MRRGCLTFLLTGIAMIFAVTSLYAAAPDTMKMEDASYKHTKEIVEFSHKKHAEDYKVACGECHHDKDGKALNDLTADSKVQKCIECHSKPGKAKGQMEAKGKPRKNSSTMLTHFIQTASAATRRKKQARPNVRNAIPRKSSFLTGENQVRFRGRHFYKCLPCFCMKNRKYQKG